MIGTSGKASALSRYAALIVLAAAVVYLASVHETAWAWHPSQYAPFHTALELLAVTAALLMASTAWNIGDPARPVVSPVFGAAFCGVAILDFLHLLSFPGMPDFITANTPHKAIIFWLAGRLLQAAALLLYTVDPSWMNASRQWRSIGAVGVAVWVLAAAGLGFISPQLVPATYLPGSGLTSFKMALEWLVIGLLITALLREVLMARQTDTAWSSMYAAALILLIGGELLFTLYREVHDAVNALGHLCKIAAYALLYRLLFLNTIGEQITRYDLALRESRHHLESALQQKAEWHRLIEAAPDGILVVGPRGEILQANPMITTLFGYAPAEICGQPVEILLPERFRQRHADRRAAWQSHPHGRPMAGANAQLWGRHKDGGEFPVDVSLSAVGSNELAVIVFVRDVSERQRHEAELVRRATHDELTGLPNRRLLLDRMGRCLARVKREGMPCAILLIDLDNFKLVNDNFGHSQGDLLLKEVATRLVRMARAQDTVARLGGDEFVVLLDGVANAEAAQQAAKRFLFALSEPIRIGTCDFAPNASMGLCVCPDDGMDPEGLLRHADMAMYAAKAAGRGTFVRYHPLMMGNAAEDLHLLSRLRRAVQDHALTLLYQPQVEIATGHVIGAEALLRWHDAELGPVPPDRFIPLAESSGLILHIGDWVIDNACRQVVAWQAMGIDLMVAVNVSPQQFRHPDLPQKIRSFLDRHGCPARLLEIEITESTVMQLPELAAKQLAALRALGLSIALDDFGTGHSSLARLARLPVDKIKIDRSLIAEVPGNKQHEAAVRATIILAQDLDMELVVEGVETEAQRDFLAHHGCAAYQGWLFSKAVPPERLTQLLRENERQEMA